MIVKITGSLYDFKKSSEEDIELTEAQKNELDKRLANHKKGKFKYYTIEELKDK
ncbi:MAG: addiction module protein [Bacteroidetes bacterium]|nr:addiction module protein [Bacteroidota bacterium]